MIRSRTLYAVLLPAVVAGGVLLTAVSSRADDDDDDDVVVGADDSVGTGTLTVHSKPVAEVYLNGMRLGTTPLYTKVAARRHKLTLVTPDGEKHDKHIEIQAGTTTRIAQDLSHHDRAAAASAGASDQVRAARDMARTAADQARQQIEAARRQLADNDQLTPQMRAKIVKRLDKALKAVEKRLGNLSFDDLNAFGDQMDAFGDSMAEAFDGMGDDFEGLGKDIRDEVRRAIKRKLQHGHGIHIDGGGDDDDIMMVVPVPPVPPVPPIPPVPGAANPHGAAVVIDMSDLDLAIDLDALRLGGGQKTSLRQVITDEQRVVQPAEEQLEQLSEQLRDALEADDVDEATIGRFVDQMAEREAAIRKARLVAWTRSRKLLDDDQRRQVERAAQRRHRGP